MRWIYLKVFTGGTITITTNAPIVSANYDGILKWDSC